MAVKVNAKIGDFDYFFARATKKKVFAFIYGLENLKGKGMREGEGEGEGEARHAAPSSSSFPLSSSPSTGLAGSSQDARPYTAIRRIQTDTLKKGLIGA